MSPDDIPPTVESLEIDLPNADEIVDQVLDLEAQKRLRLRALVPLLQTRSRESDPSGRVQLALDLMFIAACDRIRRILTSDLDNHPD